jgi:hypothetical protein
MGLPRPRTDLLLQRPMLQVVVSCPPSDLVTSHLLATAAGRCLVEIRPEARRRHNSRLKASPSFEGDTAEGPLGGERDALLLTSTFAKQTSLNYI